MELLSAVKVEGGIDVICVIEGISAAIVVSEMKRVFIVDVVS